jgi:hypothetical protein
MLNHSTNSLFTTSTLFPAFLPPLQIPLGTPGVAFKGKMAVESANPGGKMEVCACPCRLSHAQLFGWSHVLLEYTRLLFVNCGVILVLNGVLVA